MRAGKKDSIVIQVTMHVIDGDGVIFTVKIASQLIGVVRLLKEGGVIELSQFLVISFQYNPLDPCQKILLALLFVVKSDSGRLLVKVQEKQVFTEGIVEGKPVITEIIVEGTSSRATTNTN